MARERHFGGSKYSEGEKNFGGRIGYILFFCKHTCPHEGEAYVYLEVPTKGVVWEGVLERALRGGGGSGGGAAAEGYHGEVHSGIPSLQPFATMHRYLKAIGDVDTTKLPKWTSLHR